MERKIRYLEFIQNIISRMANNSFMLKGWAITLVSGIFVLIPQNINKLNLGIMYIPIIMFWFLDTYYLQKERSYRSLYDKVRLMKDEDIDFSLKTTDKDFGDKRKKFWKCLFSATEAWFYISLAVICACIITMLSIGVCKSS